MGVKRCAWGLCRSDSRLTYKASMSGVFFVGFPKPKSQPEKCDRWIRACARADDFGRNRITKDTYVCSLHFVGGKGPTEDYPDPYRATASDSEIRSLEKKKRRPPRDRSLTSPGLKSQSSVKKQRRQTSCFTDTQIQDENLGTVYESCEASRSRSSKFPQKSTILDMLEPQDENLATSFESCETSRSQLSNFPQKSAVLEPQIQDENLATSFESCETSRSQLSNFPQKSAVLEPHDLNLATSFESCETSRSQLSNFPQKSAVLEPQPLHQKHNYSIREPSSALAMHDDTGSTSASCDVSDTTCHGLQLKPTVRDASTQTVLISTDLEDYSDLHLKDVQLLKRHLFIKDIIKDDKSCKFYTGIASLQLLTFLFTWLKPKAERLTLWKGEETSNVPAKNYEGRGRALSTFEGFLMILVRLRRGLDLDHLSDLFGIASSTVSRYYRTWLEFMCRELDFLIVWPTHEQIRSSIPKAFKHFRKTVGIIDCTEFFIQRPSLPSSQRITWSQYKNHNTFKALVSISPNGAFTYVSDLWTGSASDRRITQESGFLEKLNYGDDIMADRGFLIRDLLALRGATLNIPPFAHGRQLSSAAVTKTRRIACARIHVERAIGRLKNFKILQGILPLKTKKLMDQTVRLCAQLCNLDKDLVK